MPTMQSMAGCNLSKWDPDCSNCITSAITSHFHFQIWSAYWLRKERGFKALGFRWWSGKKESSCSFCSWAQHSMPGSLVIRLLEPGWATGKVKGRFWLRLAWVLITQLLGAAAPHLPRAQCLCMGQSEARKKASLFHSVYCGLRRQWSKEKGYCSHSL